MSHTAQVTVPPRGTYLASREDAHPQRSRGLLAHAPGDGGGESARRGNPWRQTRQALGLHRGGPCCLPALALSFVIAGVAG